MNQEVSSCAKHRGGLCLIDIKATWAGQSPGSSANRGDKMNFFLDFRRRKSPVGQIRILHAGLLQCIDVSRLDPRGTQRREIYQQSELSSNLKLLSSINSAVPHRYSQTSGIEIDENTIVLKEELAAAFRMMAATRSGDDKSGDRGTSLLWNETSDEATRLAMRLEKRVVQIIREIAELVRNSGHPKAHERTDLRDDDTFAYFCEEEILALLVLIAKDTPNLLSGNNSGKESDYCLHGVVWSPRVKAQVLHSVGLLISGSRNASTLYYILSQHCINELILSMMPLSQWTDPATEIMLPAFVDLLKSLALRLGGSPDLFPLFTIQHKRNGDSESFPLLAALIQVTTSVYAQSDSYIYATCLNLVTGLMRTSDNAMRQCICHLDREQLFLCNHMAKLLLERYRRISHLAKGPVVDSLRSNSIVDQLQALDDLVGAVNDVFWCNIDVLSVRLCEILLQHFVAALLHGLLPGDVRKFINNAGVSDYDVIPDLEAAAQASSVVLSHLLMHLEYGPLLRMIYVAFVHPKKTKILVNWKPESGDNIGDYTLTRSLNATVLGQGCDNVPNPYRNCILETLAGNFGEWRAVSASGLLENVLNSMDQPTLVELELLPQAGDELKVSTTDLEDALVLFLGRQHSYTSEVSTMALESVSSLAMLYLCKVAECVGSHKTKSRRVSLRNARLLAALHLTKQYFYDKTLEFHRAVQVDGILIDVVKAEVKDLYRRCTKIENRVQSHRFVYHLPNHGTSSYGCGAEPLVRKLRGAETNDVKTTRFYARMALHFRAVCNVAELVLCNEKSSSTIDWIDDAGDLTTMFGCLLEKPHVGTHLDLHGRMTFPFFVRTTENRISKHENLDNSGRRHIFFDEMQRRKSAELLLVMDSTDMFVVQPIPGQRIDRDAIICTIPLFDVVASAADDERLHVAVRHDNVHFLIKNGNLLLTFDTPATCLVVAQYLDRSLSLLRKELCEKIVALFSKEGGVSASKDEMSDEETISAIHRYVEIPDVK